jgi:hypothetical protein
MQCEHPGCTCADNGIDRDGRKYCSDECASLAAERAPGGCDCGHPDCK